MKLKLAVNAPVDGQAFQPSEPVRGHVEIHNTAKNNCKEQLPIHIVFQGTARIKLKPGFDALTKKAESHRQEQCRIFYFTQKVYPKQNRVDNEKTDHHLADHLVADFTFVFPSEAKCCPGKSIPSICSLAPSTRISSSAMDIRIVYSLTAVCKKPGRLNKLLHTRSKARRILSFQPEPDPSITLTTPSHRNLLALACSKAWLPINKIMGTDKDEAFSIVDTRRPPPPYSPAISLDVVLLQPAVLSPGQRFPIGLLVRVPSSLVGKTVVRSLAVDLCCTTTARIASSSRDDRTVWPLWNIKGRLPLQNERVYMACGQAVDGVNTLCVPSDVLVLSAFSSCRISRAYSLRVRMGVSRTEAKAMHYTKTSISVELSRPPPDYLENVERTDDTAEDAC